MTHQLSVPRASQHPRAHSTLPTWRWTGNDGGTVYEVPHTELLAAESFPCAKRKADFATTTPLLRCTRGHRQHIRLKKEIKVLREKARCNRTDLFEF